MKSTELGNRQILSAYQQSLQGGVRCLICPHNCNIREGTYGLCKTRINVEGKLYSIAYGNPCSVSVDPIEKKPLFHFFPGHKIFSLATAGCNFRCLNCQNWQISQYSPQELNHYEFLPQNLVQQAIQHQTSLIAFTYTEPTVFYEYMYDTAGIAYENGLQTVLISNGYINSEPLLKLIPYLSAANIDLKCFDNKIYRKLTGGSLQPVLDTLITLINAGIWLEITNLLIPGYNDNPEMTDKMCRWLVDNGFSDTPLHFSRFFPNYKLNNINPTQDSTLIKSKEIALKTGVRFVYIGNSPHLSGENTICPNCNHVLIERHGFSIIQNNLRGCKCGFCGEMVAGVWS